MSFARSPAMEARVQRRKALQAQRRAAVLKVDHLVDLRGPAAWVFEVLDDGLIRRRDRRLETIPATLLSWSPAAVRLHFRREDTGAEFSARISTRIGRRVITVGRIEPLGMGWPVEHVPVVDSPQQELL